MSAATKILIVDDYELSRNGLLFSLKAEGKAYSIVGEAQNGEEAIKLSKQHQPDVVLMDLAMPVMDGIEATHRIKQANVDIKVIILTSRQQENEIYAALAAGADAYCMKDISTERLIQIIQMILEGGFWLDPSIAGLVMGSLRQKLPAGNTVETASKSRQAYRTDLTERELEVLGLMVESLNNKEIAETLNVSIHTIKAHVSNIMQKLAVDDRTQAAITAMREGLIPKK